MSSIRDRKMQIIQEGLLVSLYVSSLNYSGLEFSQGDPIEREDRERREDKKTQKIMSKDCSEWAPLCPWDKNLLNPKKTSGLPVESLWHICLNFDSMFCCNPSQTHNVMDVCGWSSHKVQLIWWHPCHGRTLIEWRLLLRWKCRQLTHHCQDN